jgi:hypothetical protein
MSKKSITKLVNPFTARSGMDPRFIVGRDDEIDFFEKRLMQAIAGRCQHYVITGGWGIGKTILLRQMKLSAQKQGAWAALFSVRAFSGLEGPTNFTRHVLDMVVDQLPVQPKRRSNGSGLEGIGGGILGFTFQVQWNKGIKDKDPQLVLRNGLLEIYEHARKKKSRTLILLIDDLHNLSPKDELLTLLRNVLSDDQLIRKTNILVVVASTEESWAPYLKRNNPIGRLFLPRRILGPFNSKETRLLINETLSETLVTFDEDVKDRIFEVTCGHVFEVQALCEALFDQQLERKVTMANWDTALRHTLLVLADAQFSGMIERASEKELSALHSIATSGKSVTPASLKKEHPEMKSVAEILKRLTKKGLVHQVSRGKYVIGDELFREYLRWMRDE